jgi:hypothetical protein
MSAKVEITSETKTRKTIRLGYENIYEYLRLIGIIPEEYKANIGITVNVPSGGDYSGMSLDIDHDTPIIVEIVETKTTESIMEGVK